MNGMEGIKFIASQTKSIHHYSPVEFYRGHPVICDLSIVVFDGF